MYIFVNRVVRVKITEAGVIDLIAVLADADAITSWQKSRPICEWREQIGLNYLLVGTKAERQIARLNRNLANKMTSDLLLDVGLD